MNLTQVVEEVASRVDSSVDEAHGFIAEAMDLIIEKLNKGEEVSIRGLGTFKWVRVPEKWMYSFLSERNKLVPPGYKLRFVPAGQFSARRSAPDAGPRRDDKTGGSS